MAEKQDTALPIRLTKKSQESILQYCKQIGDFASDSWDHRSTLIQLDLEYYRENLYTKDQTRATLDQARGNKRRIADLVVPIVEPQIETSLAYLTSVFLTGNPIFGVVSPPDQMDVAKSLEAVIDEDAKRGSWVRQFMKGFRDGLKYNLLAFELDWCVEKTASPFLTAGPTGLKQEPRQMIWAGNKLEAMDLYNTMFDLRVAPAEMHTKGEFVGYVKLYSRVALKEFLQGLPWRINVTEAFESASATSYKFFVPEINWATLNRQKLYEGMDWSQWISNNTDNKIQYKNVYEVYKRYCRIIPSDFELDVPSKNTPQIFKIITVNDSVVVYIEKMTNAHNYLPILFGQPIEDGNLSYQTKSLAQRLVPMQDAASAFWNARLAAKRRSISDRGLYNPLFVRSEDINSEEPNAKIPVRSSAYGRELKDAYLPIPFEDRDSSSFVSDAREMMAFANFISGQNPSQQGQFVKGNKTMHEYEDIMGNSSGRQEMMAHCIESQIMIPLKEMIKINIVQYKSSGDVYSASEDKMYPVDPVAMQKAILKMKMADGLLPKDKLANTDVLQVAMQTVAAVPVLQAGYDLPKMFTYMMETQGLDLQPFELQVSQQGAAPVQPGQPTGPGAAAAGSPPPAPAPATVQ